MLLWSSDIPINVIDHIRSSVACRLLKKKTAGSYEVLPFCSTLPELQTRKGASEDIASRVRPLGDSKLLAGLWFLEQTRNEAISQIERTRFFCRDSWMDIQPKGGSRWSSWRAMMNPSTWPSRNRPDSMDIFNIERLLYLFVSPFLTPNVQQNLATPVFPSYLMLRNAWWDPLWRRQDIEEWEDQKRLARADDIGKLKSAGKLKLPSSAQIIGHKWEGAISTPSFCICHWSISKAPIDRLSVAVQRSNSPVILKQTTSWEFHDKTGETVLWRHQPLFQL